MDELLKKLAGVLEEGDLTSLKVDLEKHINEEVEKKLTVKSTLLESEYKDKLATSLDEEKKKLYEENEKWKEELDDSLTEEIDIAMKLNIDEKFDKQLIESFAINEALAPCMNEVISVISKYAPVDIETASYIAEADEKLEQSKKELNEALEKNVEISKKLEAIEKERIDEAEKVKKNTLIESKISSLNEKKKEDLRKIFEDKDFQFIEKNIDLFVSNLTESKTEQSTTPLNENRDAAADVGGDKQKEKKDNKTENQSVLMLNESLSKALNGLL